MRRDIGAFDVGRVKVVEIIDRNDRAGIFREQIIDQMRADKTRAAGYKNFIHN